MKTFLNKFAQNPVNSLTEIIEKKELSSVFLSYALGVISIYFALKLNQTTSANLGGFFFVFLIWFAFNVLLNFVFAATSHLFLELTGSKSSSLGIFVLLGISQLFLTLLIPWCLISQAFMPLSVLTPIVILLIIFAQLYFVLTMFKKIFAVDKTNTLLAFFLSFILPAILSFGFVIFMISVMATLFA